MTQRAGLRPWWGAAVMACAILCCGCGSSTARRPLNGTVTYQGQPIPTGQITFLTATGPPGPASGALIQEGRFDIPAEQGLEPGTYRVAISWAGPGGARTPEQIAAGASTPAKELIPPKYNTETTLTVEIAASGKNEFTFALE